MPATLDDLYALVLRMDRRLSLLQAQSSLMEVTLSQALDDITREVEEARSVGDSAIALIQGLADEIRTLKDDPAALEELAARLSGQTDALATAVKANTPAENEPSA